VKPTGAAATRQLVLADAGAVLLALPVESVAGAVPWPAPVPEHGQAARLPRRGGAVCGVLDHFGAAIALLDLSLWVDIGRSREQVPAYRRALILQHRGRRVAIGVDQVRGLQTLPATAIERLVHDDDPAQIFHSTVRCAGGGQEGLASLLDVERLMALAQTWSEPGPDAAVHAQADATGVDGTVVTTALQPCGVVAGRDCRIAFAIADLAEVVPAPPLLAFPTALTEGLCLWRGRQLPVTSLARCLPALAPAPVSQAAPALMAVFQHQGMALGMLIDEVPAIVALPVAESSQAAGRTDSVHCAFDGALIHLVDSVGLFARFPEAAISRESAPIGEDIHGDAATNDGAHLVYEAAGCAATPLAGIEAVLKLPPLAPQATHMSWRGGALALRDLRSGAGPDGTVIVIRDAVPPAGVIVDAVKTLVQARSARLARLRVAGRGDTTLLTTGAGAEQETYAVRDLSAPSYMAEAAAVGAPPNP
jgi:chemotaxis signal transduction protein